jgi:hypothetical protein
MAVVFRKMCDKCYRMVGDNEKMFAFKLIDDENVEKVYKGHKQCMDDMVEILSQLYGTKEHGEDDNR